MGLYQLAQECKQIVIQQNKIIQRQRQVQPPIDQFIIVPDLPTIQQEYSLQSPTTHSSRIPVPQKNRAHTDPQKDYRPRSPATVSQNNPEVPTPLWATIQEVQPLLGTTQDQIQQLQSTMQPQDIEDILGTEVLQGYVETPLKLWTVYLSTNLDVFSPLQ